MARPDHDGFYKRFFGDPQVVAQLMREFIAGPWLADLDLDGMERLNAAFQADTGERRDSDMVWRIPRRDGGDTYLVLLLEFQSTPDPWMALRVLVYAGLLWQHLIREKRIPPGGRLPPILPVVVYNGDPRWQAPETLSDLITLAAGSPLWRWQPAMRYYLIDEGAFGAADLERREGLPPLLFRLETSPELPQIVAVTDALIAWLDRHPGFSAARLVFLDLINAMVGPPPLGVRVPENLLEARNMLATRPEQWKRDWRLEGRQEGRQEGLQEGEQLGRRMGEVAFLVRQLERRFGALPGWARERVSAADAATLEEWGLRVLDAGSLDDVLA